MTAIRATFSQYAMVKSRGVLVLHMEVPLEQQAEIFKVLGYPLPGEEVWCGIARLKDTIEAPPITASERGKARYRSDGDMEKARTRAGRLPDDVRFRAWVARQRWNGDDDDLSAVDTAIKHIRETCCAGESRQLIAEDEACYRAFLKMELQYMQDTGLAAVPR